MTEIVEVTIKDVERLHLEPGDVLVYAYPHRLTPETADLLKEQLQAAFNTDIPVVILDRGAKLQVVNKSELENA